MADRYDFKRTEEKWLPRWEAAKAWATPRMPEREKRYVLEMYPYPSGDMHVGHVENYTIGDAIGRFWKMRGHTVLHPFGFDSFGLPAENAAIRHGVHPAEWTEKNIAQFTETCKKLAFAWDWDRAFASHHPEQYKWNQWIFLRLFERGLAYRGTAKVNWCPKCQTVLANEQVSSGYCWRHEDTVPDVLDLEQWFYKITDYADRLLTDLDQLEWSDAIRTIQRNWIGRSEGARVAFKIAETDDEIPVFTTRPDTLYGVTFFVFAAEHPVARKLADRAGKGAEFATFVDEVRRESEIDRLATQRERKAFALDAHAVNPLNGELVPCFASDYVLMEYGTGAIMAVPAHDQRDFEFAQQVGAPVRVVVKPSDGSEPDVPFEADGVMVDSGQFTGTPASEGKGAVIRYLEESSLGTGEVQYRMRDWLISRQRYWGTPFPVVHCPDDGVVAVPDEELPVLLPEDADFRPTGEPVSPLANATDWVNTTCPKCGGPARRETDTMDGFMDSSWYFLRFTDPHNDDAIADRTISDAWMPVDQYTGGIEHAVMHLMYARFITKFLYDLDVVGFVEPFKRLMNHGMITLVGREMSKSSGHSVEPREVIEKYGVDALRVFILFIGPPTDPFDWPAEGPDAVIGAYRFVDRVWRLVDDNIDTLRGAGRASGSSDLRKATHRALAAITERFGRYAFNTAISELMTLQRTLAAAVGSASPEDLREGVDVLLQALAPIAPYVTEELWERLGASGSVHDQSWPEVDASLAAVEQATMVVQIDARMRATVDVPADIGEDDAVATARALPRIAELLDGREVLRTIARPPNLVNFVLKK